MRKTTPVLSSILFLVFVLLAAGPAVAGWDRSDAAEVTPPASAGDVKLVEINDRRTSPFPELKVSFSVPSIGASEVFGQRVLVRSAADDTGRSLAPETASDTPFAVVSGSRPSTPKTSPAVFHVSLASPSRAAKLLTVLSGEVELYVPGKDPAAVVTIWKILPASGSPLADKLLEANGIEIRVISKSAFDAELNAAKEEARQKAKSEGLPDSQVEDAVAGAARDFPQIDQRFGPTLKVTDPKERIAHYSLVDATGREVPVFAWAQRGFTVITHSETETSGPGWGLRLRLFTPESVVRRAFSVRNVKLP